MIVVDRIEEEVAILETEDGTYPVPRTSLPPFVKEGDLLVLWEDRVYRVDEEATKARRNRLFRRFKKRQRKHTEGGTGHGT